MSPARQRSGRDPRALVKHCGSTTQNSVVVEAAQRSSAVARILTAADSGHFLLVGELLAETTRLAASAAIWGARAAELAEHRNAA